MACSSVVPQVKLGSQGLVVSQQGLGCMGMTGNYGLPKPEPDMINLIHHAIDSGVTFLDTSDVYGPHTNEILVGKVLIIIINRSILGLFYFDFDLGAFFISILGFFYLDFNFEFFLF